MGRGGVLRAGAGSIAGGLAALLIALAASAQEPGFDLADLRWLAPGADPVAALTAEPAECLAPAATQAEATRREIGRALFRTPTLLGGQAARAGLSCAACHRNGRDNPDFAFVGVSGEPGTADVTSSFLSSHRGDGVDNPVAIPDLAGPRDRLKVDRGPESGALEAFVRGLIVEEFDGPEPSDAALGALAAYVRGLSPDACPAEPVRAVRVADRIADAKRAVALATGALEDGDGATATLLLAAARAELERIHARYAGEALAALRDELVLSASVLGLIQQDIAEGEARRPAVAPALTLWGALFDDLAADLEARESASLFAADVLSRTLAEQP